MRVIGGAFSCAFGLPAVQYSREGQMNQKTILTGLAIVAVAAIAIVVNWPEESHARWGNTYRDENGPTINYSVYGHSSGELIAGVLIRFLDVGDNYLPSLGNL